MEHWVFALLTLRLVVVEQDESLLGKQRNGDEVAYRHESHEEIDNAECLLQGHKRASKHNTTIEDAEEEHRLRLVGHKAYIGLAIEVIADDRTVGEEEYRSRDEISANRSYLGFERLGSEHYAIGITVVETCNEHDESRAGANQQGVGEDSERLQHLYRCILPVLQ